MKRTLCLTAVLITALGCSNKLNREILDESLEAGKTFLLSNQKPEGNFVYEYDFVASKEITAVSPVRQAGALWGVSLIHQDSPSMETKAALEKGFAFFKANSRLTEDGARYVTYPGSRQGSLGTVALCALALIEYLRADFEIDNRAAYEQLLDEYLDFLWTQRLDNKQFAQSYSHADGSPVGNPSPYFDGETLLALCKAARFLGYEDEFKDRILESADAMYEEHVALARKREKDSAQTKGFYQWGSMSFYQIHFAGWANDDRFAERTIELAYWMIDTHRTLQRTRNTAYAHEGMISAYALAEDLGNEDAMKKIARVVDEGLYKLTTWQVRGPRMNRYLRSNLTDDPHAVGGIMNKRDEPTLRIDVTQHQMHAVILARKHIYTE